jgi:hypothetical protein
MTARNEGAEIARDIGVGTRNDRDHAEPGQTGRRSQKPAR